MSYTVEGNGPGGTKNPPGRQQLSERPTIAVDGPVASGKTTVGKLLAAKLGLRFLDTGMMYRGLAWLALRQGLALSDDHGLGELARTSTLRPTRDGDGLSIDGRLLTQELRTAEVEAGASRVAQIPEVRQALVEQQRAIAHEGSIVMVGRDIGTVVAPKADLKVFLSASPTERAQRRFLQKSGEGMSADFGQVLADLEERDARDIQRSDSPLRPAEDAYQLDTDGIDPQQVVERVLHRLEVRE